MTDESSTVIDVSTLVDGVAVEALGDMDALHGAGLGPGVDIDLARLADAQDHYRRCGYRAVAAPWIVPATAVDITLPDGACGWTADGGELVGSAEQGFIAAIAAGIDVGRAQAFGPCFRWGDDDGWLHRPCFAKVELIDVEQPDRDGLAAMIAAAVTFHTRYVEVTVVASGSGLDIVTVDDGIEIGSYGIRSMVVAGTEHRWVYGTGCAEPRLSVAIAADRRRNSR